MRLRHSRTCTLLTMGTLAVLAAAGSAAGSELDTTTAWDGAACAGGFGPSGRTAYGVIFEPPAQAERLQSIAFPVRVSTSRPVTVRGAFFWMQPGSSRPYMPPMHVTAPQTLHDTHGGFDTVSFAISGVNHPVSGESRQYLAFVVTTVYDLAVNGPSDSCFGTTASTLGRDAFSSAQTPSGFADGFGSTSGTPAFRAVFSDAIPTRLTADPALPTMLETRSTPLRAHLTTVDGTPLARHEISFYERTTLLNVLCRATTDATGTATCTKSLSAQVLTDFTSTLRNDGYLAAFWPDYTGYGPSTATATFAAPPPGG